MCWVRRRANLRGARRGSERKTTKGPGQCSGKRPTLGGTKHPQRREVSWHDDVVVRFSELSDWAGIMGIAAIVGKEEAACRQLFSRAKKHIATHRPRFAPDRAAHRQLLALSSRVSAGADCEHCAG
jgi:hypothetical protein